MPGVLPYALINNETYFLLGKESTGGDQDTWSFFCGGREEQDASNKMAACREAHEESAGVLGKTEEIARKAFSLNGLKQSFLFKVKDPSNITNDVFLAAKAKYTDQHYLEMSEIKWIKASELVDALC